MRLFGCAVCGRAQLQEIEEYSALPRVTSDCKPFPSGGRLFVCGGCGAIQKLPDERWRADIRKIYDEYDIYQLSGGSEQLIFTAAGRLPRSQGLVDFLRGAASLPSHGRLIDIGCGNGAALATFAQALPGWRLYGSELSDRALARLQSLPNFIELYTVPIGEIAGGFDLVSMIHSLEHMPSPRGTLEAAKRILTDGGILFVEVPDVETSLFDLLVADHLIHFSRATLGYLLAQVAVSISVISNTVLPREITMIGRAGSAVGTLPVGQTGMRIARANVGWLGQVLTLARDVARAQPFGIFGTSISGMWLFGSLPDEVSFFVDEDPSKIGRKCAGKPILSPLETPRGATVFIPLAPEVAKQVAERHADAPARFVPVPFPIDVAAAG